MLSRFQDYAVQENLFNAGDKIVVGISGGCDSMMLAQLLIQSGVQVMAAHVNYGLRAEESDADEAFVRHWCKESGIEYRVLHASLPGASQIQEQARTIRYHWFRELKIEFGASAIAVAHHMNDQAETILFNLARGTGLKGAAGMQPKSADIIRPMLIFTRAEIESEAQIQNISFRNDSSNTSDKYKRNLIRNQVIPAIENVNPQAVQHIASFAGLLNQYSFAAEQWCKEWVRQHVATDGDTLVIPIQSLEECPAVDAVLHHILQDEYTPVVSSQIRSLFKSETGKYICTSGHVIVRDRQNIRIAPGAQSNFRVEIMDIPTTLLDICIEYGTVPESFPKGEKNTIWIGHERVSFPIVVRNWTAGDRMQPLGMSGHQKVSDILMGARIPADFKARIPVVEIGGEIAWVAGLKVSGNFPAGKPGERCVVMKLINSDLKRS